MDYFFETRQLGFSDIGLHVLRNKFNYETVAYTNITLAEIKPAKK